VDPSQTIHADAAKERMMRLHDVILRAMAKRISWMSAAEIRRRERSDEAEQMKSRSAEKTCPSKTSPNSLKAAAPKWNILKS
jgi:hypothetical protein